MNEAKALYAELFKLASERKEVSQAVELLKQGSLSKAAPWILGAGGLAALPIAYGAGKSKAEEEASKKTPIAFASGAAAGAALPQLLKLIGGSGSEKRFTSI